MYCDKLFLFWKTGIIDMEVDTQITTDTTMLIKLWEACEQKRYFEFWSNAFGGKKGNKK